MRLLFNLFGMLVAPITLPGTVELLLLTVAGILPGRQRLKWNEEYCAFRLAVIVPAHNEELHIARCIKSIQSAVHCEVSECIVVADNCDDLTATIAEGMGARVLVRTNSSERGKGYALDFAFRALEEDGWDAFAVVDADSEVASDFFAELIPPLAEGAAAVQCRYVVRNAHESIRTRLMKVANAAFNVLRPRGRDRCGLSAGIYGNGFALSADTLQSVPYVASSLVEDLEYHLALIEAGRKVHFVDTTSVYGDMPVAGAGVKTQRTRWEGGRFRMLREKTPRLIIKVFAGRLSLIEPCLDLLLLPLAFHVSLLLIAAAASSFSPVRVVALVSLGIVALHLAAAIVVTGGSTEDVMALFAAPFYIAWKILLIPRLAKSSSSRSVWSRTERAPQRNIP